MDVTMYILILDIMNSHMKDQGRVPNADVVFEA